TQPLTVLPRPGYDAAGNRPRLADPVGNLTSFAYDALDRLTVQTDPLGKAVTSAYDADSRLTLRTDRDGRQRQMSYDALGRETAETWLASGGGTDNLLTYAYDAVGNQLTAADSHGAYTMGYDALDRVTSTQEPFGLTLTSAYDAVGNRTLVQDSQGGVTTSVYDALDRLTSRRFGGAGLTPLRFDQAYDARGDLTTVTRYSDL